MEFRDVPRKYKKRYNSKWNLYRKTWSPTFVTRIRTGILNLFHFVAHLIADIFRGTPICHLVTKWKLMRNTSTIIYECKQIVFKRSTQYFWSRVSSVSIVSDYGLDDRAIGVRSPAGTKDFSSILCVQTGSGAHPAPCKMGSGGPFLGGKARPGREADHSPPSSAEVVNE
jgi:hypothetical protein